MGGTASSAFAWVEEEIDEISPDTRDIAAAVLGGGAGALLGGADAIKRNLIDNPAKKAKEMADKQIKDQRELTDKQAEAERLNDLDYRRDQDRARAQAAARRINATQTIFTSPLGITNSQTRGGKTLVGS